MGRFYLLLVHMVRTEARCRVVAGEKLTEKSEEGGWKKGVIRMVRKRWRGVAPYFYTVWPLFCIIPHLARSSRDAGLRYADHHHAENPNLPSVSLFRRMMDDVGRPTRNSTSWFLFSYSYWGGRVPAGTTNKSCRDLFATHYCYKMSMTNRYIKWFVIKL